MKTWFVLGAFLAALGVMAGAFGAHALKGRLSPDMLAVYETGARYHLIHALGLLAVGLAADRLGGGLVNLAGGLLTAGIVLFSGSLYALAISGVKTLGIITPFGGLAWIVGWIVLGVAALKAP
jgi:uncharacterized membrane protein YgdD (TMEM256/DUF423 family)